MRLSAKAISGNARSIERKNFFTFSLFYLFTFYLRLSVMIPWR